MRRIDPARISRDPAVVRAYAEDPLVYHHGLPAGVIWEFLVHAETLGQDVTMVTLPTLLLYGTGDESARPPART